VTIDRELSKEQRNGYEEDSRRFIISNLLEGEQKAGCPVDCTGSSGSQSVTQPAAGVRILQALVSEWAFVVLSSRAIEGSAMKTDEVREVRRTESDESPQLLQVSESCSSLSNCEDPLPSSPKPSHRTSRKGGAIAVARRRFSRQSSLSWGHKPHPILGLSCLLFALPVPFFWRECHPYTALLLAGVTLSSYASDHQFTGLESYAHSIDRFLAPITLGFCLKSVYTLFGFRWMTTSLLPIACLVLSGMNSKRGNYSAFVLWHSLWHILGVGSILVCFLMNKNSSVSCKV